MNYLYFDIETAPLPDAVEKIRKLKPFDPDSVKMGNIKDPAKRNEKLVASEVAHYDTLLEKAALDPRFSYVCAVGTWHDGIYDATFCKDPAGELECIQFAWRAMNINSEHHHNVGWNSHKFDLPFLLKRSWVNRQRVPSTVLNGNGFARSQIDLMKVWCANQYGEFAGLTATAEFLGVAQPRAHGVESKHFHKVLLKDPEAAQAYLADDLTELARIGEIIL